MEITKQQADERLSSQDNLANRFNTSTVIETPIRRRGKKEGLKNIPLSERNEIAIRSRTGESQKELASEFGVTQATISNIEIGKTPTDEKVVSPAILSIQDRALNRLMSTLGLLDDDKLSGCNAKDLSGIAANMAKVVAQTMPKEKENQHVTVHVYAPEQRAEHTFRTAQV